MAYDPDWEKIKELREVNADLLAALEGLNATIGWEGEWCRSPDHCGLWEITDHDPACAAARTAIAKAQAV